VRTPVEISRTETLYSLSPVERTILRPIVPCDDGQATCSQPERVGTGAAPRAGGAAQAVGGVPAGAPFGAQSGPRPGQGGGAAPADHDHHHDHDAGAPPASIVWMPDYCQQYAIVEKDHSGSQKVQIQLADGWKLTALNTETNNTEILQKMFDALSNVAGSFASASHAGTTTVAGAAAQAVGGGAQSAQTRIFRRTRVVTFRPGLYQLLEYPLTKDNELDCSRLPSFRTPKDATEQSESWSEITSQPVGVSVVGEPGVNIPAAPVDPGRPATVARPPLR
jgi:hypothetical protein